MLISIIILNYNGMANNILANCLTSLAHQNYHPLQIIVVDNNSNDASVGFVKHEYEDVILVENNENYGFCKGNNVGFRISQGKFLLFANNDTIFHENCIETAVKYMQQNDDVGFVSPKIIRPLLDVSTQRKIDSAGLLLRRDLTLRDKGFADTDCGQFDIEGDVFGCCGAAFFARREALESVLENQGRLWDEKFFAYYEDGDLSWRLQNAGWRCFYLPEAIVTHFRGASSPPGFFNKPALYKKHTIKNRYLMIIKNASLSTIIRNLPFILLREILIWVYLILHPKLFLDVVMVLRATIPDAYKTRKDNKHRFSSIY